MIDKAGKSYEQAEKKLLGIIFERGVDNKSFAIIRSKVDQALLGAEIWTRIAARRFRQND